MLPRVPLFALITIVNLPTIVLCILTIAVVSLPQLACKESTEPPPPIRSISLETLDASCTEAWIKAATTDVPATVALLRDNQRISITQLLSPDSLLIDEGLLPTRTYMYQLQKLGADSSVTETSVSVQVTTMDTTSHNWSFSVDTLGVSASTLYDVTIINDTLAYAVGEMYLRDSTGELDQTPYNFARWDGRAWDIMRIQFYTICGQQNRTPYPASSVFAFSEADVWIAMDGSQVARWNGSLQTATMCLPWSFSIRKLWGENPNSVYAVGDGGSIAHYTNGTWQRVQSGTMLPIMDVYGARNNRTGEYEILCAAEAYGVPGDSKILSIENSSVRELTTHALQSWGVEGVWFMPSRHYVAIGQGVWRSGLPEGDWWLDNTLPGVATTSISGQGLNDITVCGAFWLLATWNGVRWQTHFPRTGGSFGSVTIKGNTLIAVGDIGNKAVVVRGTR